MVRLRDGNSVLKQKTGILFQFLYGAIERDYARGRFLSYDAFQFLYGAIESRNDQI